MDPRYVKVVEEKKEDGIIAGETETNTGLIVPSVTDLEDANYVVEWGIGTKTILLLMIDFK